MDGTIRGTLCNETTANLLTIGVSGVGTCAAGGCVSTHLSSNGANGQEWFKECWIKCSIQNQRFI